jgi:hypothetical protein
MIVFERAVGAVPMTPAMASVVVAHINIALSKVAPPHVRTTLGKISHRGRLSTMAREGASAAMLLHFKKEIIEAARKVDRGIINVIANESWMELKILVAYERYRHPEGLENLRAQIEAENEGVIIPPFSMRWLRAKRMIEDHHQRGKLPGGGASVVFKVPNKAVGQKLLSEMWVAGNRFKAHPFIPDKADTLCGRCSAWGHSEFRCHNVMEVCGICSENHLTAGHRCEVVTCGAVGRVCPHVGMKCPNCGGAHPAQDGRCRARNEAIGIARGARIGRATWTQQADTAHLQHERQQRQQRAPEASRTREQHPRELSPPRPVLPPAPATDRTEEPDQMEGVMEAESSGTAQPVAV